MLLLQKGLINMNQFIKELGNYKDILPRHTIQALKGQTLAGDLKGAKKGLKKVLSDEYKQIQLRRLCGFNGIPSVEKHRGRNEGR